MNKATINGINYTHAFSAMTSQNFCYEKTPWIYWKSAFVLGCYIYIKWIIGFVAHIDMLGEQRDWIN